MQIVIFTKHEQLKQDYLMDGLNWKKNIPWGAKENDSWANALSISLEIFLLLVSAFGTHN